MRKRIGFLLVGSTVAAVVAVGSLAANAEWVIGGSSKMKTHTAKMPRGTKPSVAQQSKAAVVSWSAQEVMPGVKMDRYTVTAHSADVPAKPDIVREINASGAAGETITFAAEQVAGGQWRWTVIPRFATWVGPESRPSKALKFAPPPAANLVEASPARKAAPAISSIPAPVPTAESTPEPVDKPTTPSASPDEKEKEPTPAASSPAAPGPPSSVPESSASGSAAEDIPK